MDVNDFKSQLAKKIDEIHKLDGQPGQDWKGLTRTMDNMSDQESVVSPIGTFKNRLRQRSMEE